MVLKSLADMIEAKIELTKNMFNKVEPCLFVCVCGWGVGGNAASPTTSPFTNSTILCF